MIEFEIRPAEWPRDRSALRAIRTRVFIVEQKVPPELEWDGLDAECIHVLAWAGDEPIGTGRLTPDGYIGRMAVLSEWRGKGVGSKLLAALVEAARKHSNRVARLHAQTHALVFYERHGFHTEGKEFMEAGIPHRTMLLELRDD